jgi:hypothetical protein
MSTLGRRSVFALTSRTTTCLQACCTRAPTDVTSTPRSLMAHLDEACVVPHRGQVQRPPPLPPRSSRHAAPPEGPMRLSARGTAGVEHGREGSKRGEGYGVERGRGKGKGARRRRRRRSPPRRRRPAAARRPAGSRPWPRAAPARPPRAQSRHHACRVISDCHPSKGASKNRI